MALFSQDPNIKKDFITQLLEQANSNNQSAPMTPVEAPVAPAAEDDGLDLSSLVKNKVMASKKAKEESVDKTVPGNDDLTLDDSPSDSVRKKIMDRFKQQEDEKSGLGWREGIAALGQGIAGNDPTSVHSVFEGKRKAIDEKYTQQAGVDKEINDKALLDEQNNPNSPISKQAQELSIKLGSAPDKVSGQSYTQLNKIQPLQEKIYGIDENNKTKVQIAKDKNDFNKVMAGNKNQSSNEKQDYRKSQDDQKEQGKIGKELNELTTSSRSTLGLASKQKLLANRALDIVNDPNSTPQDFNSVSADLNQIISGTSTVTGSEHQQYNSLANEYTKTLNYWTNSTNPAENSKVRSHLTGLLNKMNSISDKTISSNTKRTQAAHSQWIKNHPDEWQAMLDAKQEENSEKTSTPVQNTSNKPSWAK